MKKVFLTAAVLLGGLSTFASSTIVNAPEEGIVIAVQEEYKEINVEDLPQAVKDALATDYESATLDKAYVSDKQEYKLDITIEETSSSVYIDKDGNWIDQE